MTPTRTSGSLQVHLHWIRETPSRGLIIPVSQTLSDLDTLPESARAAVLADGRNDLELHLPPLGRADSRDLGAWQARLQFRTDAGGRLVASLQGDPEPDATSAIHQALVLVFRAASGDQTPLTLVAEPGPSPVLPAPSPAIRVCESRGGLAQAPAERSSGYFDIYRCVSREAQRLIRQWVPAQFVQSPSDLADLELGYPLIAWSALDPFVGKHVDQLAIDVLQDEMVTRGLQQLPKTLPARLRDIYNLLADHDLKLAAPYCQRHSARIIDRVQRQRQDYYRLMHYEFRLIVSLVLFCSRVQGWVSAFSADPELGSRLIIRGVTDSFHEIHAIARHFYHRRSQLPLVSGLIVEAVRQIEINAELPPDQVHYDHAA